MNSFEPVGDRARWRVLYEILQGLQVDDVLTYERMGEALELDPVARRQVCQMALRRAAREYEQVDKHALEVIPTVGYRVVQAPEHLALARQHQVRAKRSLQKGQSKVINVDLNNVEPDVRNAFHVVAQAFSINLEMQRRLEGRQSKLEATVAEIVGKSDRSAADIAEVQERLERLERRACAE